MLKTFRLGIFIVTTLLLLAVGIFLIGKKQLLFTPTYSLKALFTNVAGLDGGAEVRVGGIHEGTVKQIQLPMRSDDKVTVVMDLNKSTRDIIKKDSIASIETEGLLGSKYVTISFGSDSSPKVQNGDTIASEPPIDFTELMKKANDILVAATDTMRNVDETAGNFKSMSAKINQGKGTIGALINDKEVYNELNATAAQAKAGAAAFHEDMDALKQNWFLRGFFNKRGYKDSTELTKYEIADLPEVPYLRKFEYDTRQIFDKPDSPKLKNEKALNEAGRFLSENKFGLAVVEDSTGMKGDTDKDIELSQAQSMVVREYLVKNFRMDDTRFKTLGLGKNNQMGAADAGKITVVIYPEGISVPSAKVLASAGH